MARKNKLKTALPAAPAETLPLHPAAFWPILLFCVAGIIYFYGFNQFYQGMWRDIAYLLPHFPAGHYPVLGRHLADISLALGFAAIGAGAGMALLFSLGLQFGNKVEGIVVSLAAGWGLLGLVLEALCLAQLWHPSVLYSTLGLFAAAAVYGFSRWTRQHFDAEASISKLELFFLFIWMPVIAYSLYGCLRPDTFYDGMVDHLAITDLYLIHHGAYPTPHNLYSGMPRLVETLYAVPLLLDTTDMVHLVHFTFGFCVALLMIPLGKKFFGSREYGYFAALMFAAVPMTIALPWKSNMDLGLSLYLFASIYCMGVYLLEDRPRGWLWLGAFLLGLAAGTKYTAWPVSIVLFLITGFFVYRKKGRDEALRLMTVFGVITAATVAIWPLKNWLLYRNPVYPFIDEHFAVRALPPRWQELAQDGSCNFTLGKLFTKAGFIEIFTHPVTIFANKPGSIDFIGATGFLFVPFVFLPSRIFPNAGFLRWIFLGLWAQWLLTTRSPRFFYAQMALPVAFMSAGMLALYKGWKRALVLGAVLFLVASNFLWATALFSSVEYEKVIMGAESRDSYLGRQTISTPLPVYSALAYANEHTPRDAKVLIIGDERGFYLKREFIAASVFDTNPLVLWVKESAGPDELYAHFKKNGITHIVINRIRMVKYPVGLTPEGELMLRQCASKYFQVEHIWGDSPADPAIVLFSVK